MRLNSAQKYSLPLLLLLCVVAVAAPWWQTAKPGESELYSYRRLKGRQTTLFDQWAAEQNTKKGTNLQPAAAYASLSVSQRTTYEAVTHALSRSRLTAEGGKALKANALELIEDINEIAGQVKGARGDLQFRVYVRLAPDAQDVLTQSREFFRDKDNTVFHKGYPNNYRQRGKVPTVQISIANEGGNADIDVDYRSSKAPKSLVNGHLRSANSDVRVGGNYLGHVSRWFGLIRWWRIVLPTEDDEAEEATPTLSAAATARQAETQPASPPTALTPEQLADAREVAKAANDFLTTWLVKRNRQMADDYLTRRPVTCINVDTDEENEVLSGRMAIREFALLLDAGLRAKGKRRTLEEAVGTIEPWDPDLIFVDHPYKGLFALRAIQRHEAGEYMCGGLKLEGPPEAYGQFYLTDFVLKLAKEDGGGLELLWMKEDGKWQIVSYSVLEP